MPAGAGTPRYENWVHWLIEGFSGSLYPTPLPWLGTSPSPTSLLRPSAVIVRATVVGVPVPAGAGTPRYENWMHWLIDGFSGRLCPTPLPWLGTSPNPTSFLRPSAVVVRATVVGVPVPAGAGTPRYENWMHWLIDGFSGRLCPTPLPWLGTSPSPTSLLRPSAVIVRATVVGVAGRCRLVPARQGMTIGCIG